MIRFRSVRAFALAAVLTWAFLAVSAAPAQAFGRHYGRGGGYGYPVFVAPAPGYAYPSPYYYPAPYYYPPAYYYAPPPPPPGYVYVPPPPPPPPPAGYIYAPPPPPVLLVPPPIYPGFNIIIPFRIR